MTWYDLKNEANKLRPAFWYDDFFSKSARGLARIGFLFLSLIFLFLALELVTSGTRWFLSLFYFALAGLGVLSSFEFYYNSMYYGARKSGMTFEIAQVVRGTDDSDVTKGFIESNYGQLLMMRLGVTKDAQKAFLASRQRRLDAQSFSLLSGLSMPLYAQAVYKQDPGLKDELFKQGVLEADWTGAAEWIARDHERWKAKEEWWSMKNLSKIQGLGKAWSYGQVWLLEKYGSEFAALHDLTGIDLNASYHRKEVEELETVLARSSEANAMVVGEDGAGKIDVVARLAKRISNGTAHPAVEHKQVYELDTNALVAATGEKNKFELELMRIMKQSIRAGNVILVIPDLQAFIVSASALGSDAVSILDPYISTSAIQVVALCDTMSFHQSIETNGVLMERFEKISITGGTDEETIRLLEDKVGEFEAQNEIFFTYQALGTIADSADRYFTSGIMPDKAIDLLIEIIPNMKSQGRSYVTKQDVLNLVEKKTGIPVAGVKQEEREKLTKLEAILHERVIGQEHAVDAIANAMRRARSGVSNPNRPMGSFLFLGPTGVGKTETTKALAEVFFGDEGKIIRLDMSEYSADDALTRLIGSFQTGKAGTITTMLRERPYGVLLLDEFEKANKEVHNLFLQVLDEGVFSDMMGKKVNARNLIIIATSNAGSDKIWEMAQQGRDVAEAKNEIIDDIITKAIYRPELLNRFDGVVLFHPLKEEHLREVARKMLKGLKKRLEERKINLGITDDLIEFLVKQGSDPKFGARPLNRAIQEKVEGVIADKIIRGSIPPGAEVVLTKEDLGA